MANRRAHGNGAHRHSFWNLAIPKGLHTNRLSLDRRIPLARSAVRSLVRSAPQGAFKRHNSLEFKTATPPLVNGVSPWSSSVRGWSLYDAMVAGGVAGWFCFRTLRFDAIGASHC